MHTSLVTYLVVATLLVITPGLDTALVLRTAFVDGKSSGYSASAGIAVGCLAWGASVAAGLGALIVASRAVYTGVRWAGAAYLTIIGIGLLVHSRDEATNSHEITGRNSRPFRRGALTNLLNPKVGLFYLSLLPQFIPPAASIFWYSLLLAAVHAVLSFMWLSFLTTTAQSLAGRLRHPFVTRMLDRLTGLIFVLFAVNLAVDSSRD